MVLGTAARDFAGADGGRGSAESISLDATIGISSTVRRGAFSAGVWAESKSVWTIGPFSTGVASWPDSGGTTARFRGSIDNPCDKALDARGHRNTVYCIQYTFAASGGKERQKVTMDNLRQRVSEDQPIVSTPLSTQLYDRILARISTGVYPPGKQLKELELCKEFNVSRTPLREALFRLVDYGVVENTGRIARVAVLSERDVKELFEVRRVLELEAIRLACGKLTADDFELLDKSDPGEYRDSPEFVVACQNFDLQLHRMIGARSGNGLLARKLRKLHDRVQLVCRPTVERLHEHREIVAALRAGDRRAAIRAMKVHLGLALKSQLKKASSDVATATGARRA